MGAFPQGGGKEPLCLPGLVGDDIEAAPPVIVDAVAVDERAVVPVGAEDLLRAALLRPAPEAAVGDPEIVGPVHDASRRGAAAGAEVVKAEQSVDAQSQHQGKAGGCGGEAAEPLRPEPGLPAGGLHQGGVHVVQGVQDVFRSHTS